MTHGKTYNKSPRRINHKATKSKTNTRTTALERSVEQTTAGFKALPQPANFTLGPDATLNTETHKNSVRIKAPNSVNALNQISWVLTFTLSSDIFLNIACRITWFAYRLPKPICASSQIRIIPQDNCDGIKVRIMTKSTYPVSEQSKATSRSTVSNKDHSIK